MQDDDVILLEALGQAERSSLPEATTDAIVSRAKAFHAFLTGKQEGPAAPVYEPAPNNSGVFMDPRDAAILLHQYSEWLDVENIQIHNDDDGRTHEDLVKQFLASRHQNAIPMLGDPLPAPK